MAGLFKSDNISYRPLLSHPRSLPLKILAALTFCYLLYAARSFLPSYSSRPRSHACSPQAWAAGEWRPKQPPTTRTNFTTPSDAYEFLGFDGCASNRELFWHLGADSERLYERFPAVSSWKWSPPARSCHIREFDPTALLRDLVQDGGWLLIGDSVTENHFFSLSCLLSPHVRATPDYVANPYFDRAWPQNLYLNPDSPLVATIGLPPGFDIAITPLVTFRRIDLLYETPTLDALYKTQHPDAPITREGGSLFSNEATWNLAPAEYVKLFTAPLPRAHYSTMVVSTGGHWTTSLFAGLRDEGKFKEGIEDVIAFFGEAMEAWADEVQALLLVAEEEERARTRLARRRSAPRQVVVRAYLPGHEDCHDHRAPLKEVKPGQWGWYNWNQIGDFNRKFETVIEDKSRYPNVHFLPIDRPALLRPDAHVAGDCLHIMTGAGVLEGWTHYIWHYVTVELPGRKR